MLSCYPEAMRRLVPATSKVLRQSLDAKQPRWMEGEPALDYRFKV